MALQKLTKALRARETPTAVLADIEFHNIIGRSTKNSALLTLIATIEPIITENRRNTIEATRRVRLGGRQLGQDETVTDQRGRGVAA